VLERPWKASGFVCELVGVEGCDKHEGAIFEQILEGKGRSTRFCQLDSTDNLHDIHLKVVRSAGIHVVLSLLPGQGDRCQVVSLDMSRHPNVT